MVFMAGYLISQTKFKTVNTYQNGVLLVFSRTTVMNEWMNPKHRPDNRWWSGLVSIELPNTRLQFVHSFPVFAIAH
jgi:hypothetical protein